MTGAIRSTCPYCGVGCGVVASRVNGTLEISGDAAHPANHGRLCSKGAALGETLGLEDRLLHPAIGGRRSPWDEALTHVAGRFAQTIREQGSDSVAFYVSGQLLTEDYYVANKLMKGFIGSANIDTNSRLCMASAVAGHKRAFGGDLVPGCYEDLQHADLIVLVGSNTAWCHPVLYRRIEETRAIRPELRIVVIDPRRTPTCELADLHLPIRAGSDVWLFNGLLAWLHQHGITDMCFVGSRTEGLETVLGVAERTAGDVRAVASACGVDEERIADFYRMFADTPRVVTMFSQGVNQSSAGTDKVNAIINCHLFTGRIGKPGAGPFSITGQPNAMGGREVGGMANMLAAHMSLEDPAHRQLVQNFWASPAIAAKPGLKAVELFEGVAAGRIKALWIMATNPVVSLPNAQAVRAAIEQCPFVVVSDCVSHTDTSALADVLLPAAAWGEKDGTVTNSERRISRQRAFLPPPGEARPDWWIICEVARRMGFAGFGYTAVHEIFDEHARLSAEGNAGSRAFDIGGLAGLSGAEYDALEPVQWPVLTRGHTGTARLFSDGRFFHPDGKARFVATAPRAPVNAPDDEHTLVLNTGRVRDQWHSMTRSGRSPRLTSHLHEPYADLHPQDALASGLKAGELTRVSSRWGSFIARLRTSGEIARGSVFAPIHWNDQFSSDARVGVAVNPVVDPLSGEPEFKHTPVRVEPFPVKWYGFVLTRRRLSNLDVTWWTVARGEHCYRYELAGRAVPESWTLWMRPLVGASTREADLLEYQDDATGVYRAAHLIDNRLDACVFISPRPQLPSREWLAQLFGESTLDDAGRAALLAGAAGRKAVDTGPVVCSCFRVGRKTLCDAIVQDKLTTTEQVGRRLRAGTNCGSCLPEIRALFSVAREC